jgi:molecular chaperone DnaK
VLNVTRQEFEAASSTLITRSDLLVDSVLVEAGLNPDDISNCFLVGGSTRMPRVKSQLAKLLGHEPVCHANPDEVVAMGAALYSGVNADPAELNTAQATALANMKLQEVANHYFGTLSLQIGPDRVPRLRNSILIDKNSKLPASRTESYYTVHAGQTAVDCRITQSATREHDPDFVRVIWKGDLGPLPEGRPPNMEIRVTYSYDLNQVMHCEFEDVATGLRRVVDLGVHDGTELSPGSDDKFVVE